MEITLCWAQNTIAIPLEVRLCCGGMDGRSRGLSLVCGIVGNEIDTDRGRYKYTSTLYRRRGCRHADRVEDIDTAFCSNPITEHHPNRPGSECIGKVARQVHMAGSVSMLCFILSLSLPPPFVASWHTPVRRAAPARRTEHGRVTLVSLTVDAAISV
jgi:hypothetical protein